MQNWHFSAKIKIFNRLIFRPQNQDFNRQKIDILGAKIQILNYLIFHAKNQDFQSSYKSSIIWIFVLGSKRRVKERLKPYVKDPYACDLIDRLLWLDPSKRVETDAALDHDFFWTDPMPCSLEKMLSNHNASMFEYLAPRRGGGGDRGGGGGGPNAGGAAGGAGGQNIPHHGSKAGGQHDGYKDMVY